MKQGTLFEPEKLETKRVEEVVNTEKGLNELLNKLDRVEEFIVDVETSSKDIRTLKLLGIGFYYGHTDHKTARYIDLPQFRLPNEMLEKLKPILEGDKLKTGHNLVFEWQVFKKYGIDFSLPYFDTMVAAWLLDERKKLQQLGLKRLAKGELNLDTPKYGEVSDADKCLSDVKTTCFLRDKYRPELERQGLTKPLMKMEMPLIPVIGTMQMTGIKLDLKVMEEKKKEVEPKLAELRGSIYEKMGGKMINLNSPKQIADYLFDKLKLTEVRGRSTDEEVLKKLAKKYSIANELLKYRELEKLRGTYIDGLLKKEHKGILYPGFLSPGSRTGRLSCSAPNLQNIPPPVRPAFIAREGMKFVIADYNQIELRLAAHYSREPRLIEAFIQDRDVHQETADTLHISRYHGKTVNFGVLYGITEYGLAAALDIPRQKAAQYLDKYWNVYSRLKACREAVIQKTKTVGVLRLLSGRLRRLKIEDKKGERRAFNSLIQGGAADIIKIAMGKLYKNLLDSPATMLLTIHDEILTEVLEDRVEETSFLTRKTMVNCIKLRVPLKVDIKISSRWEK